MIYSQRQRQRLHGDVELREGGGGGGRGLDSGGGPRELLDGLVTFYK